MYLPTHFREERPEILHALVRDFPLATLVSAGETGLTANHLPMLWKPTESGHGVLRGHLARANTHWQELARNPEALAIFQGPQAYISPAWYPTKRETGKVVPTWNYATVHCRGTVTVHEDPEWLRFFLTELTARHEGPRSEPWSMSDAPADYIDNLLHAIVGIELAISGIEGKWKVSQNQPERNREGAASGLGECPVADLIRRNLTL